MIIAGIVCFVLAALVAALNICLKMMSALRKRRGMPAKYTNVPFLSMALSILAWFLARDRIGAWAFLPILADPLTLTVLKTPWFLIKQLLRRR